MNAEIQAEPEFVEQEAPWDGETPPPLVTAGYMLDDAMAAVKEANASGINIHGKRYTTVATRVDIFRQYFGAIARLRIAEKSEDEKGRIAMKAVVEIYDGEVWQLVAEGHAEEVRGSSAITRTSALEVCETSAYGRALANFGLHGGEFASANEVENAVAKQGHTKASPRDGLDLTQVDPELATQYADGLRNALALSDTAKVLELHDELATQTELYVAVGDKLKAKERADLRSIVQGRVKA